MFIVVYSAYARGTTHCNCWVWPTGMIGMHVLQCVALSRSGPGFVVWG